MNRSTNRAALIALLVVFASAILAVGVGVYRTKASHLQDLKQELAGKQRKVEEVRAEVKHMPALEATYQELYRQVAMLEPALPTEAYIPTFLSQIQTLAGETHNRLVLIKPKPKRKLPVSSAPEGDVVASNRSGGRADSMQPRLKAPESPYDDIGIEVGLDGTYWSALEFLERLRAFPKMIAVNDLVMKPKTTFKTVAATQPLLEITVHLTAVIAKEK